jgi:hypothetical protein
MGNETIYNEVAVELIKFQFELQDINYTEENLKARIADRINDLITNDFFMLISLLYRLDISEKKLKQALNDAGNIPAGKIIADMIIKRQVEKLKTRQFFKGQNSGEAGEDKW